MRLLAWKAGKAWSQYHVAHFDEPLCRTPVPDRVIATVQRTATPSLWAHTCQTCRDIAMRSAGGQIEIDGGPVIDLMAALKTALKTKPADSGKAVDGLERATAQVGAVTREDTSPAGNGPLT